MAHITICVSGNVSENVKAILDEVLKVKFSIVNAEGRKITIPAILGILAFRIFPLISFATLFSFVCANISLRVEKEI